KRRWIRSRLGVHACDRSPAMTEPDSPAVRCAQDGSLSIVTIDRPEVANAIDAPTATALGDAFRAFDADESLAVAVLTGANGTFCAGADLKAARSGDPSRTSRVAEDGDGPVGPTRLMLRKPVIAAG